MPADHGCWLHNQHDLAQPRPCEHRREDGEDGPVRIGEPGPVDLSLEDEDLMAECEDLSVAFVSGRDQPSQPADHELKECRTEIHRPNVPTGWAARNSRNTVVMDFRHPQGIVFGSRAF